MPEDDVLADQHHPAARAADQQGPALSDPSTAYTGQMAIASGVIGTAGFSPSRDLSPLPDTDSLPLAGRVGPRCSKCNQWHWGHTLQCTEYAEISSRNQWFNCRTLDANEHIPSFGGRLPASNGDTAQKTGPLHVSTSPFNWWQFPAEVRNIIYDFSLHWPNSYALYRSYNKQLQLYYRDLRLGKPRAFPQFTGHMKSPTILLLCKMIKNECIHILRSRPFIIDQIPPWLPGALRPMKLLGFVGRQTLRNLRYIDIRIALGEGIGSGWVWKDILQEIFDALHDESHFVTMRIMIKRCNVSNASLWDFEEQNKYLQIKDMIACFEKAAPNVWTPGQVIVEDWVVQGRRARRVMPHVPEDEQEMYYYPNRDIWPGSMLEFVQPSDPVQRRPSIGN